MSITAPSPVETGPVVPDSSDAEATFDAQMQASLTWQRDTLTPGMNALAVATYGNAVAAEAAAAVKNTDTYKGTWAVGTTYALGDSVMHAGAYWLSNTAGNVGNTPATGSAQWAQVFDFSSRAQVHAAVLSM